jgi:hypothetical protein
VEISTYRVPVSETSPVPAEHQDKGTGAELTAMYKYSAQLAKQPLAQADAALMAEVARSKPS